MAWTITADKFLTNEQVEALLVHLERERDLSIARSSRFQAIKTYYLIRGLLETGCRVFEFCALKNGHLAGHKILVRLGKGGKPRTILIPKATANLLKEWLMVKHNVGLSIGPEAPLFPAHHGGHYSTRGVRKIVKATFARLNFPKNLSVHSLRHTNCSLLLQRRVVRQS